MADLSIAFSVFLLIGILVGLIGIVALVLMIFDSIRIQLQQKEEK